MISVGDCVCTPQGTGFVVFMGLFHGLVRLDSGIYFGFNESDRVVVINGIGVNK